MLYKAEIEIRDGENEYTDEFLFRTDKKMSGDKRWEFAKKLMVKNFSSYKDYRGFKLRSVGELSREDARVLVKHMFVAN